MLTLVYFLLKFYKAGISTYIRHLQSIFFWLVILVYLLEQGWATSWTNSLSLIKKIYFWPELSSKTLLWDRLVGKGYTEWRVENKCLNVRILDKWKFMCGPGLETKSCLTEISDFKHLFSTLQCNPSKPICPTKDFLLDNSGQK